MKAKLVKESIVSSKGKSFGETDVMELVNQYFPYLENPEYIDFGDRDNPNVHYGEDEEYAIWDYVGFDLPTFSNYENESGSILFAQESEQGPIGVKIYVDSIAYNGQSSDDEYIGSLELVDLTSFSKEDYDNVMKTLAELYDDNG